MATGATTSRNATLKIKVGSGTLTEIKEVKDFSGLDGGTAAVIDVTHLGSSSKEKLAGLPDAGSMKFTLNHVPTDAGQKLANEARKNSATASFELTFAGEKHAFDGLVLAMDKMGGVDKANEVAMTIEITGPTTATTATA